MLKFTSTLCAAAMALTVPFAAPAIAMPMPTPAMAVPSSAELPVLQVQQRWDRRDRFERRGGRGYYNDYRGYRERRPGYRYHEGYWFPPAAFIMGAIIGGALGQQVQPPIRYRPVSNAHIQWCYNRFRSYRASDNTFQPYNGPRRQCRSPYG